MQRTASSILSLLLALAPTQAALGQGRSQRPAPNSSGGVLLPEEACYDVLHYGLELAVDPEAQTIQGDLKLRAALINASESLIFDLGDELEIGSVTLDGAPVAFSRETEQRVRVPIQGLEAGREFELDIAYGGKPRRAPQPPWRGGFTWKKTSDGSPWIATSCQGEGADLWWPCKDHPSDKPRTMDLAIEVPDPLFCASNGRLVGKEPGREGWTRYRWHVSTPISNYAVALNIAPYVELTRDLKSVAGDDLPVHFWVLPEDQEQGAKFLDEIADHLAFFEKFCGPYPFRGDKYGVVETPHLGMEHQSIIAYGNHFQGDPNFDYDWLHQHELAHEWWGNLVTARDWNDFWIHEGIGTYMQPLYLEQRFGKAAYFKKMRLDRGQIQNRGAVAPREVHDTNWMYFSNAKTESPGNDIYYKGSWICHNLRWLLGEETFFKVLRRWAYPNPTLEKTTDGSACRLTDTDELLGIANQVSGQDLDWFFELYLRQPALPKLESSTQDGELVLRWIAPAGLACPMPVPVRLGERIVRVECPDGVGRLPLEGQPYEIDPEGWLLKD